jgi:PAS domain S-box-containing protein
MSVHVACHRQVVVDPVATAAPRLYASSMQTHAAADTVELSARHGLSARMGALLVLAAGLFVAALSAWLLARYVEGETRARFEAGAELALAQLQKRLDDFSNIILGLQGLFIGSERVDREEFRRYCENLALERRLPGLQALSYQRHVRHAEKAAYIEGVRNDRSRDPAGYPDFTIRPPGERPDYVVIDFIEPMAGNLAAFGYDAATEEGYGDAIRQARDSGRFRVSAPAVQDPGGSPRLVLLAPVYRRGLPTTNAQERRKALEGFVALTIDSQTAFEDWFQRLELVGVRIGIEDAGPAQAQAPGRRTAIYKGGRSGEDRPLYSRSTTLEFGGRVWSVHYDAYPAWLGAQPGRSLPFVVAVGAALIGLLLAALYLAQARSRERAQRLATEMTRVLRATMENIVQGISVVDADLKVIGYNRRFLELLDFPPSLVRIGAKFEDIIRYNAERGEYGPGDSETQVRERVALARRFLPHRLKRTRPNGVVLEIVGTPLPDGGFVTTYTDVTEQEQAQAALRLSEQRYRKLVELSPDAIFVHRKHIILIANPAAARLWGVTSAEEAIGRNLLDFIHPASRELVKRRIAQLESDPALFRLPWVEQEYLRVDGTAVSVEGSATVIELEDGPAILSVIRDISLRKAAEDAVRKERDFRQKLIESVPGIFFLFDTSGRFLMWNKNLEKVLGVGPEQLRDGHTLQLYDEADHERIRQASRQALAGQTSVTEVDIVTRDGGRIPYVITGTRIEADGRPVVIGLGIDITMRKEAERLIRELNETLERRVRERTAELEASNRELESFSYSVSHDLRAPLRALNGFSHLLEEEYAHRLDANGLNYLARIRAASQRMGELIDDLLDLARVSRQELRRMPVDCSALAADILASLEELAPQRKVSWHVAAGLSVRADPVLAKVLLENLLRNAWKFTAERADARIEFDAAVQDGETVYCVRDNGVGFDPAYAGKLFQPFQRLHDAKRFEGTGIGLAIVQRIVHRHGGRVWAESQPGQGAAFFFTLP